MTAPAVVVIGPGGCVVGRRVQAALPGARLHGLASRVPDCDETFADTVAHLRRLYAEGTPILGVCAAGILIRALAPLVADKRAEPPVLALAEDGTSVVPLLGGHRGANALARRLADILGGHAALTTAGDGRFGVALDAPPPGWRLANPQDAKAFMAELLAGAPVAREGDAPWLTGSRLPFVTDPLPSRPGGSSAVPLGIRITPCAEPGDARTLVYHPAVLAVGIGCERGTAPEEVVALVQETLHAARLAPAAVALVASLDLKADEPALHAAARELGVPARFFSAAELERETPRLVHPSAAVFREVGCHGVAEAAALAAAGPDGRLMVPKRKSRRATCAVAAAPAPLDPACIGRPRGRLLVIGIGPGAAAWRTPEADQWLSEATDLVGYHLYLDLLGPAAAGKRRHGFDLGAETDRVRCALDLAAAGRSVALVSSGDPGIYAMAALVFELLERTDRPDWRRVEVAVAPGISALQAAAARAGAPLGHDFCALSLSDLLTPWPVIARRIRAAAEGDFVIAVYNPVSRRRTTQLAELRRILLAHRPAGTPVVLARNLGRAGETVRVTTLDALDPAEVDMLTLVLIGSSATRRVARGDGGVWVYTPRGYEAKTHRMP